MGQRGILPLKGPLRNRKGQLPSLSAAAADRAPSTQTHTRQQDGVCERNLVLRQSLRWASVVCCASEMKVGLSNNSEFNTRASPLMRMPCAPGSYPQQQREKSRGGKSASNLPLTCGAAGAGSRG